MLKSAIIFAEAAEERRAIGQLVKPTKLFSQIYFSSTVGEVDFLLESTAVDVVFCAVHPASTASLQQVGKLAELTTTYRQPLVLCSALDPIELEQLGAVPARSTCLNYAAARAAITLQLQQLLGCADNPPGKDKAPGTLIDKATGVYNRFYFDRILDQEISRSKLTGRPFSLLLIEPGQPPQADHNGWGRQLPTLATAIRGQVRTSDLLCRVEQQRLALLMPETSSQNAQQVLGRLRNSLAECVVAPSLPLSFGLASAPFNHADRLALLRAAEASL